MSKSAILILTQNTIERKIYLKTTLYFLFKNFNAKYKYPVIILHEGDYDNIAINEISTSIRKDCRYLIEFKKIDSSDFEIPKYIDEDKMNYVEAKKIIGIFTFLICPFLVAFIVKFKESE